jgi:cholesterol oxidase
MILHTHPLGGAVLGLASDIFGRLKGYNNLYCLDGSMIPGFTSCANPALTIAALAERNMETILSEDFNA